MPGGFTDPPAQALKSELVHNHHPRGSVEVRLKEPGDTRLQVEIREGGTIQGNVPWDNVEENDAGRIVQRPAKHGAAEPMPWSSVRLKAIR
jgi:hypothetical protein